MSARGFKRALAAWRGRATLLTGLSARLARLARPARRRAVIALTDALIGVTVTGLTLGLLWQGLEAGAERDREHLLITAVARTGQAMMTAIGQDDRPTPVPTWDTALRADPGLADLAPGGRIGEVALVTCLETIGPASPAGKSPGPGQRVIAGLAGTGGRAGLSPASDRLADPRHGGQIGQVDRVGKMVTGPGWHIPADSLRRACGRAGDKALFVPGSPVFVAFLPGTAPDPRFLQRRHSADPALNRMARDLDMGGHDIGQAGRVFAARTDLAARLEVAGPTRSGLLTTREQTMTLLAGPLTVGQPDNEGTVRSLGATGFGGGLTTQDLTVRNKPAAGGRLKAGTAKISQALKVAGTLSVAGTTRAGRIKSGGAVRADRLNAAAITTHRMATDSLAAGHLRSDVVAAQTAKIDDLTTGCLTLPAGTPSCQPLPIRNEICAPAAWVHDLPAGRSYRTVRRYTEEGGKRHEVSPCRSDGTVYNHHYAKVGWEDHDDGLFALPLTRVFIAPPQGRYTIASALVLSGAQPVPYQSTGETLDETGTRHRAGCVTYADRARTGHWTRPNGSTLTHSLGAGPPLYVSGEDLHMVGGKCVKKLDTYRLEITGNPFNPDMRALMVSRGWDGQTPVDLTLVIAPGVIIGSDRPGRPALDLSGFPAGSTLHLINHGRISGAGGQGANSGPPGRSRAGRTGGTGGTALRADRPLEIDNRGGIFGGGGGGGTRGFYKSIDGLSRGDGSGGGGAGAVPGQGGSGNPYIIAWRQIYVGYEPGQAGTALVGGAGGPPLRNSPDAGTLRGGRGGDIGQPGESYHAAGGLAGYAIDSSAAVTWIAQGDLRGRMQTQHSERRTEK